jgi:hypothetical protein
MRASEVLGLEVVAGDGRRLGKVLDLRLVQDGPLMGAYAALRVESLVVGHHSVASHRGYDRSSVGGPWVVRALVRMLTRTNRCLPWEDARVEAGVVRTERTELEPLPEI